MRKISFISIFLILLWCAATAQERGEVYGKVEDQTTKLAIPGVNVRIVGYASLGTTTDSSGLYSLAVPANRDLSVVFTFVGYENDTTVINVEPGQSLELNIRLSDRYIKLKTIEIEDNEIRSEAGGVKIEVEAVETVPTPFGNIESALAVQGLGVAATNELSTTYSVRGGNYDENLVYVNGFEIFRPFLIRSGQQEGLSFVNSDLVSSVYFSSGGFQPKYGDKMSSVLSVRYKRPKEFAGSVEFSLLGGAVHLEGSDKKDKFTFLLGVRHKASQYLLKSLDTKGEYSPSFTDIQAFMTYKVNKKLDLEWITNYARNRYSFVPVDRETTFGVVNNVLRLTVFFDGQEKDLYNTLMSGFAINHRPNPHLGFKWLASGYRSLESEAFDIRGEYWLDEVETDFGSEDFGQTRFSRGVGAFHDFTRNDLEAIVANGAHRGYFIRGQHNLKWGAKYQREIIDDKINEWERLDSAGYSLPYNTDEVEITDVLKSKFNLHSNRFNAFIQDTWRMSDTNRVNLTYGARVSYWDVNKEWLVSPRIQFSFKPRTKADMVFRAATGMYSQPPFYREMRDINGNINTNLKAQKSIHAVAGIDLNFIAWNRKFKFVTEVYYKYMYDLVPYEFDNVLIRYFGQNKAKGYATGIDFRLNGELVEGVESWVSMSIMSTRENIQGDSYNKYYDSEGNRIFLGSGQERNITDTTTVYPGMLPRPTDQRVRFSLYFQDYLPKNENFKVHLNLIFATGLPFGPPDQKRYNDVLRIPFYRRVDVGFSARLFDRDRKELPPKNFFRHFKSIWATLEVYNLLGVDNTVSYIWIKDFQNTVYAVPNFLTNRRINLRMIFKF